MKESILWGIKKGDPDWMQEIITNKDMKITKERAKELRWLGAVWPNQERCKNIKRESEEERKRVKEIWDKNPSGFSSYYSTLCDIEQGRVEG